MVLCASDGAENIGCLEPRNSQWKSSFEWSRRPLRSRQKRRRAKCKSLLWKGKEGCLRIKMGPDSLGLFVEGGCFIRLGVEDLEKKREEGESEGQGDAVGAQFGGKVLRKWLSAKSQWQGNLGLAKLERGKVLLEFEM
ncbi:hypothetical protein CK203_086151 [Vitis vinifera]|uniref:DUF4283 domain-containing protein n=1 Tax=Vitis vinifera TaxID=29760 RepID=A0A438CTC1_VITVI|nr:hypothetical protein CK203_086151 [Vitis vinifera]